MEALYKFESHHGRMGSVTGVFIAEKEIVAKSQGITCHLGEALGKHSEVSVKIDEETVRAACREHLAAYKVPKRVVVTDHELPRSMLGKVLRKQVREELLARSAG